MSDGSQAAATTAVDRILEHNRAYVARTPAREFPPAEQKRLAVVACYDPRLDVLLWPALGLTPGEAFVLRTAGALVAPKGGVMRSLGLAVFMFGVTEIVVVGHLACRMAQFKNNEFVDLFRRRGVAREAFGPDDLREWAGAIQDPVRGVQAQQRLRADSAGYGQRHRPPAQQLTERFTMDVVHDDVQLALGRHDVERGQGVGVANARRNARFVQEHGRELFVLGELRMQALDGDGAREASRPHQPPEVHGRHAACGDLVVDPIPPNCLGRARLGSRVASGLCIGHHPHRADGT